MEVHASKCIRICLRASRAEALCGAVDPRWDQRWETDLDVNLTSWLLLCPPHPHLFLQVEHDPPDCQRLLQPHQERHGPPSWNPPGSLLQPIVAQVGLSLAPLGVVSQSWWEKDTFSAKIVFLSPTNSRNID